MTAQANGASHTAPPYFEERATARIKRRSDYGDMAQLKNGCTLLRLERKTGRGAVRRAAIKNNAAKSTYYEHRDVWEFLWTWRGFSARRTFEELNITYTHVRDAIKFSYEDAIEALLAVENGDPDPRFQKYEIPMTPDTFRLYLADKHGKPVLGAVLFDEQGTGVEVWRNLRGRMTELQDSMIRVIVREGRE